MKHFVALFLIFLIGCKPAAPGPAPRAGKPRVAVVNYPLAYFVERIAGDLVEVHFPAMEGDPAFWTPTSSDVRKFQSANLVLLNGASYAKWTGQASLPDSKSVNTGAAFADQVIVEKESATHQHGQAGEHNHTGTAFTTWIDFQQAQQQAAAVHRALADLLPAHGDTLGINFSALQLDLTSLNSELRGIAADLGDTPLLGSHPVYQYLARGYDLNIRSVHWEPDAMPAAEGWAELAELRNTHPARVLLWEDAPDKSIVNELKAQGVRSVVFAPCANRSGNGTDNWLKVMRANVEALRSALGVE